MVRSITNPLFKILEVKSQLKAVSSATHCAAIGDLLLIKNGCELVNCHSVEQCCLKNDDIVVVLVKDSLRKVCLRFSLLSHCEII